MWAGVVGLDAGYVGDVAQIIALHANGECEKVDLPDGDGQLQTLQALVDGYIEVVTGPHGTVILCEDGRLRGFPFNAKGSLAAAQLAGLNERLVGTVVLAGPGDSSGEITSIGDDARAFIMGLTTADTT